MAMNSNIRLDTQEQLMEDAKAKAKARYDRKLLDDQEEQIRNLLLMTGMQDPRNARVEMKPKKEYTHFEDDLPVASDAMSLLSDPNAVKELAEQYRSRNQIVNDKSIDAIKDDFVPPMAKDPLSREERAEKSAKDMEGYVPGEAGYGRKLFAEQTMNQGYVPSYSMPPKGMVKNSEGVDRGGSKAPSSFGEFKDNTNGSIPEGLLDEPEGLKKYKDQKENYPEGNWWLKQLTPKIDEALKAIADKDPELMQLPEVQELLKRSREGYRKQNDLATVAAFTSNPQMWMSQANTYRDQGDKNLMEAANNLETLRQRQLDATKAVADNLTSQKQIAGGLHNAVLGLEGNLAQVSIPAIQQANDLRLQAEQVHEAGDEAVQSAITNMQNFVQRLGDMGASAKDVASLNQAAAGLNASNIKEFIETVRGIKVNKAMRRELNERLNAISADAAKYATAMITEKKLKEQADFHDAKANGLMSAASNLGGEYKIPEWMDAPVQSAPAANDLSTPFSDEKSDVPAKEAQKATQVPTASTTQVTPKGTKANTEPTVASTAPTAVTFDPWSMESFAKLSANQLKDNIEAMATAYAKKGSSAAKVGIWQSEKGAEGNDVSHRVELPLKMTEENMGALIRNLSGMRKTKKYKDVMKSLSPNALGIIEKAAESIDPTVSTDAYDAKVGRQRQTSSAQSALDDQYALIQRLMVESGMV